MTDNHIAASAAGAGTAGGCEKLPTWRLCPFGERAEALRRERGISKAELCRRLGISVTYYDLIIHGRRNGTAQRQRILKLAGGRYAGGRRAGNRRACGNGGTSDGCSGTLGDARQAAPRAGYFGAGTY